MGEVKGHCAGAVTVRKSGPPAEPTEPVEPPANASDADAANANAPDAANGAPTGERQEQQPPPEPRPATGGKAPDTAEPSGGTLYVVGTPIGNLEDLSPRSRRVLEQADCIACEDTRHSGLLLNRLGIRGRRLLSFHAHNEAARMPQLLEALRHPFVAGNRCLQGRKQLLIATAEIRACPRDQAERSQRVSSQPSGVEMGAQLTLSIFVRHRGVTQQRQARRGLKLNQEFQKQQ